MERTSEVYKLQQELKEESYRPRPDGDPGDSTRFPEFTI